jgi:hypothetical protein
VEAREKQIHCGGIFFSLDTGLLMGDLYFAQTWHIVFILGKSDKRKYEMY